MFAVFYQYQLSCYRIRFIFQRSCCFLLCFMLYPSLCFMPCPLLRFMPQSLFRSMSYPSLRFMPCSSLQFAVSCSSLSCRYSFTVIVLKLVGLLGSWTLQVSLSVLSNLNRLVYLPLCLILHLCYTRTSKLIRRL